MSVRGEHSSASGDSLGGGRSLQDPLARWKNDAGGADPTLVRVLASGNTSDVIAILRESRLFIALAKTTVETGTDEKTSDMSVVCITATDGRIGLLAFTSVDSLKMWNADARPIPITAIDAAIAALDEGAQAVIIDPAGPIPYTVTLPDLVVLSGLDQRHRGVHLIEQLLTEAGIDHPRMVLSESGPLVIEFDRGDIDLDAGDIEQVSAIIQSRSDIHAYIPQGVALSIFPNPNS